MIKIVIAKLAKRLCEERGQALIAVLVFLMIGSLSLSPLLSYISTALKTDRTYQSKTAELYAADSGIDDAIWQIKYDNLNTLFFEPPVYDIYDFDSVWSYSLSEPINDMIADVTIQNIWIPKGVTHLSPAEGRAMIESNKLMVTGTTTGETGYKIKINFTPDEGEEEDLYVDSIGVWLPLGFEYDTGTSNLEEDPAEPYYSVPVVEDYAGGQAIIWDFSPSAAFTSFPAVIPGEMPLSTHITFNYTPSQPGTSPAAIAWMETSGVSDVPLSWDIDTRIYKITSAVGNTEIEAYSAKCEIRKMGTAIAGDYKAVGNSLMTNEHWDWWEIRETKLDESSAEVSDIPSSAVAMAAYLYWSGWFVQGTPQPFFEDDFSDDTDWANGSAWVHQSGHFKGHYSSGYESARRLTLEIDPPLDLTSYDSGRVCVSWDQWEEGSLEGGGWPYGSEDALQYQFSGDGGANWSNLYTAFEDDIGSTPQNFSATVPDAYMTDNFKFRFYLKNFGDYGEYCYVDNFAVSEMVYTADTTCDFSINSHEEEITADEWEILENNPGEYSYACHTDVTPLVKTYSNLGDYENHTGNALYTVGGVDADEGIDGNSDYHWAYAGWSLIIIYSSPETAGHQLYLYDTFFWAPVSPNVDWDGDGEPGGDITGFYIPDPSEDIVEYPDAATLTCFVAEGDNWLSGDKLVFEGEALSDGFTSSNVWNSKSVGMSEDGMDIDTFHVTWESGLLEPGDTTAQLDMPNPDENWNLVYIILSMRSETTTGGTVHYLLRNR